MTCAALGIVALSVLLAGQAPRQAATGDAFSEERLMAAMHGISSHTLLDYVKELASPKYAGRLTGTAGYEAAAKWTADLLASWNIKPAGDKSSYYQRFSDPYTLVLPGGSLSLDVKLPGGDVIKRPYVFEDEFYPGSTSDSGTVTAEVVYVGFGTTAPELGYDDYAGVDVKGKLVMMEPESPAGPERDPELFKKWRPYSFHDYKMQNAARHGAAGVVYNYFIVNPNCAFIKGFQWAAASRAVWDDVFAGTGRTRDQVVAEIRSSLRPASFATGKVMTMRNVKRSVVFVAFGAEEQGVKGSEFYIAHPFIPNARTKAMLNLESVGWGESISAGSGRNFPQLWEVIDRMNKRYIHRRVSPTANANLARPRQDAAHFLWADVPTISFGSGSATALPYATYHTTRDAADIITPEIMEDLARLVFLATVELAR